MGDKKEFYTKDGRQKITIEDTDSGSGCAGILAAITLGLFLLVLLFFVSPIIGAITLLVMFISTGWNEKNVKYAVAWLFLTLIVPTIYFANSSSFEEYFGWLEVVIRFYYLLAGVGFVGLVMGWVFSKKTAESRQE